MWVKQLLQVVVNGADLALSRFGATVVALELAVAFVLSIAIRQPRLAENAVLAGF